MMKALMRMINKTGLHKDDLRRSGQAAAGVLTSDGGAAAGCGGSPVG